MSGMKNVGSAMANVSVPAQPVRALHADAKVKRRTGSWLRKLLKNWQGVAGLSLLVLFSFIAIFAPALSPTDPHKLNFAHILSPPAWTASERAYGVLGTDSLGRDILSRILYGARVSLLVGATATLIGFTLGVPLGLLAGYKGRPFDDVITRLADVQSAIPFLVLMIAVLTFIGGGLLNVVLFLGVSSWVGSARLIRGETLSARNRDYVAAARAIGANEIRIMFRHILPNVAPILIIAASLSFGGVILTESALSFLGLGVPSSVPTWGNMLAESRQDILVAFGPSLFPGLAIVAVVLGGNWTGDWLRDVLDPRLRGV